MAWLEGAGRKLRALGGYRGKIAPVVAVADLENMVYSARNAGLTIDFAELREVLAVAGVGAFHAVGSATAPMLMQAGALKAAGWVMHYRPLPMVPRNRPRPTANSDTAVAGIAAALASAEGARGLVLLSGDGGLGSDIAWSIKEVLPRISVCVVAYREALSRQLIPGTNPAIDGAFTIEVARSRAGASRPPTRPRWAQ